MTPHRVTIVGASLAGLSTARALRAEGFDGDITLIGDERHAPYDRPPLSKQFLAGTMGVADLALEDETESLGLQYLLGDAAVDLAADRTVTLADGRQVFGDAVVLATGARARTLPCGPGLAGIHTLRTLDDAFALSADLQISRRLVVIGAGFIGSEIASSAHELGLQVTVVEAAPTPLAGPLGVFLGAVVARVHERAGVRLLTGAAPVGMTGETRVRQVQLADGEVLTADVVVVGVGAVPNVEWLGSTGLDLRGGVRCDAAGFTGIDGVYAVGDCATWFDEQVGRHRRVEHWTGAHERPALISQQLLHGGAIGKVKPVYFWSDQYGSRIQFAGTIDGHDEVSVEAGDLDSGSFLAVYRRAGEPIGVVGIDQVQLFGRWRRSLSGYRPAVPAG
ncbi:FAD-dependent oxidoreductase [Dermatophilaceae bacterium Sec6.4]